MSRDHQCIFIKFMDGEEVLLNANRSEVEEGVLYTSHVNYRGVVSGENNFPLVNIRTFGWVDR